jgi:hypothetical protein
MDVNILVYAFREGADDHRAYFAFVQGLVNGPAAYGVFEGVLSSFLRMVTNPRVFETPAPIEQAVDFAEKLRGTPHCVIVSPGPRHWTIFVELCRRAKVRGDLVPDAYLAALAIESGSEWITADKGFSRYPGLRWKHPLEDRVIINPA